MRWHALLSALSLLGLSIPAVAVPDKDHSAILTRATFGSCNKQYKSQPLWQPISDFDPQTFLWIGDAVYVHEQTDPDNVQQALQEQASQANYTAFLSQHKDLVVNGVFDDHDFGVNDGGKEVPYIDERKHAYLDFLQIPAADPRRLRSGLYSSHVWGTGEQKVKIILLDSRSFRDPPVYVLKPLIALLETIGELLSHVSAAHLVTPVLSPALAVSRWLAAMFGLHEGYQGTMLGSEQWDWFEEQLRDSDAAIHLVVSTVQVLTTNSMLECWGHYPAELDRLFNMLEKYQPSGLVLLSGDVHFAELLKAKRDEMEEDVDTGDDGVLEVTTSGMTHVCPDAPYGAICKPLLDRRSIHRHRSDAYYLGLNYGTLQIDWNEDGGESAGAEPELLATMVIDVRNQLGESVLRTVKPIPKRQFRKPIRFGEPFMFALYGVLFDADVLCVGAVGAIGMLMIPLFLVHRLSQLITLRGPDRNTKEKDN